MRATDEQFELIEKTKEAEELEAKGEYEEAEQKLAEAQAIGERLALLEQEESKEQVAYNISLSSSSQRVAKKKKEKAGRETAATKNSLDDDTGGEAKACKKDASGTCIYMQIDKRKRLEEATSTRDATMVTEVEPTGQPGSPPAEPIQEYVLEGANIDDPAFGTTGTTITTDTTGLELDREYLDAVPTSRSSTYTLEVADKPRDVRSLPGVARKRARGPARPSKAFQRDRKQADQPPQAPMPTTPTIADPNQALAAPVATASAVTLHIPAIGEAVTYQYMLQPEGKAPIVHLEARRNNRRSKP